MALPRIAATWNFAERGCVAAWPGLLSGGGALDAACAVARVAELDESVDSVGRGGTPDASGGVTLDACVMEGPSRCGAVCAVSRHVGAAEMARLVMERTRHVMLVAAGADEFGDKCGLPQTELLTDQAACTWEKWRRDAVAPPSHDTVGVLALDSAGRLAGACSTSGMAFKMRGRVGDSPIPGHGLYIDQEVGGAVATGVGELVMGVCGTFLAVEAMRRGASPLDAALEVLARIDRSYKLSEQDQVGIIVMSRDGNLGTAALRKGFEVAIADESGVRVEPPAFVKFPDSAEVLR